MLTYKINITNEDILTYSHNLKSKFDTKDLIFLMVIDKFKTIHNINVSDKLKELIIKVEHGIQESIYIVTYKENNYANRNK